MLHRFMESQHERLLIFDDVRELSIGHDAFLSRRSMVAKVVLFPQGLVA
jgi:hypothetical protein